MHARIYHSYPVPEYAGNLHKFWLERELQTPNCQAADAEVP